VRAGACKLAISRYRLGPALPAYQVIESPVRLMSGELSPLAARRVVERLSTAQPDARHLTVGGVGHMAPFSHADVVNPGIVAALLMSS